MKTTSITIPNELYDRVTNMEKGLSYYVREALYHYLECKLQVKGLEQENDKLKRKLEAIHNFTRP